MTDYLTAFGAKGFNSFRFRSLLFALAFLICLSVNARAGYLYVLNDGGSGAANRIYGYSVNESTGALTAVTGSPFTTGGNGSGQSSSEMLVIDRANLRLYAINDGSKTVSAYSISATTGTLTALPFSPIALPAGGFYRTLAVHPTGSPLIVGDNTGLKSLSYSITASTATAAAGSPFSTGTAVPYSSVFSFNGSYFYTGGNGGNVFAGFSVNAATGVLTALGGSPFAAGNSPYGYATDAQGRLFLANEVTGEVRAFTTAAGIPSAATGSPFNSGLNAVTDGALSPNGNFYVATNRVGNSVGSYQITGSGAATTMTAVSGSPANTQGIYPNAVVFNSSGAFLFAANASSRNISTFNFNVTTGTPTFNNRQAVDTTGASGFLSGFDYLMPPSAATTTSVTSSLNPAFTNQAVLFTATVTSTSTVNSGTVTFRRGATNLCSNVFVNASGVATCNVAAGTLPEGDLNIAADYSGTTGVYSAGTGSMVQQVNSPTVKTGNNFANNAGITITNNSTASPYPSRIFVSGLGGTIAKVTVNLNGINALAMDHVDLLLVGPGGQKFQFLSDAGGTTAITGVSITLDDLGATPVPDSTAIATGTYRPASYGSDIDAFPAPAPAGPYNPAATEGTGTFANIFNGIIPNGTWSLYAVEDTGDVANTTLTGWSLTFSPAPAATTTGVTSSSDPSVFGQSVTFTATVSTAGLGTPNGNVQFFEDGNPIGAPVALNGSGVAPFTTSSLPVGDHVITATYEGNVPGGFNASTGSLTNNPQTVNPASTTTGITTTANPVGTGIPVTFTATVNAVFPGAGTRTGTVTFRRNGSPVCTSVAVNASGQATCTLTFTVAGNYNITAQYGGSTNFSASSSTTFVQQVVGPTAADVSIRGRILSAAGRGIPRASVWMITPNGESRYAMTNAFGFYRFLGVPSGETYVFTVRAKGYQTASATQNASDDIADFNIVLNR